MAKKQPQKKTEKVWYAIEDFDNPEKTSVYPSESINHAVKDWAEENAVDAQDELYLYEIKLIGKISVEAKTTYEIKQ